MIWHLEDFQINKTRGGDYAYRVDSATTIIDSVVSERMKVYEASFKFEVKNAPEYGYFWIS